LAVTPGQSRGGAVPGSRRRRFGARAGIIRGRQTRSACARNNSVVGFIPHPFCEAGVMAFFAQVQGSGFAYENGITDLPDFIFSWIGR
jgi:hypothetical protein